MAYIQPMRPSPSFPLSRLYVYTCMVCAVHIYVLARVGGGVYVCVYKPEVSVKRLFSFSTFTS